LIEIQNLTKIYYRRQEPVYALNNVSLEFEKGCFYAITGRSGSGKTTLMLSIGGLIKPSKGTIKINGKNLYDYSQKDLAMYRNKTVGFVLQSFNLVPYLSALENVMIPMLMQNRSNGQLQERAIALLGKMDLSKRKYFLPRELSVGQQQRVAIARALANDPEIILADEPTGNLDPGLSAEILDILKDLNEQENKTVIIVTHDPRAALRAKKKMKLAEGSLISEEEN